MEHANKAIGMPKSLTAPHMQVIGRELSSKSVLLTGAQEGHVLVKNTNGALPLGRPNLVSLFGYGGQDNATTSTSDAPTRWTSKLTSGRQRTTELGRPSCTAVSHLDAFAFISRDNVANNNEQVHSHPPVGWWWLGL